MFGIVKCVLHFHNVELLTEESIIMSFLHLKDQWQYFTRDSSTITDAVGNWLTAVQC